MRKLIIVDDEKQIRLGLKAMIEREFADRYAVSLAAEGGEALRQIGLEPADIVITDIRMPGMDGIELIRRLQETAIRPAVVILSGHDDFQYAREAIKYEVKEYLLKPIAREELFRTLSRIEEELRRNEETASRLHASERYLEELRASRLNNIFMSPDMPESEIENICLKMKLLPSSACYYVGLVQPGRRDPAGVIREEVPVARIEALLNEFRRDLPEFGELHFLDHAGRLVIIADIPELYSFLGSRFESNHLLAYVIGLSERESAFGRIKSSYDQAAKALKYSFIHTASPLITYGSICDRSRSFEVPIELLYKIANMLGTNRVQEIRTLLQDILDAGKVGSLDIAYLEEVGRKLNELVFDQVFHLYGEESVQILKMYKKVGNMYSFDSFQDYAHSVESLLLRLNEYIASIRSVHIDHREMKKAIAYIHEQYGRDLNMAMVSNHVSLNYSYFSQSFKAYTGENFVNYLKKVRIGKAKELLEKTDYKVYEIGEKVGFSKSKQFHRAFRELEGITPNEYRSRFL